MAAPLHFLSAIAKPQMAGAMTPAMLGQRSPTSKSVQTPTSPKTPAPSFFVAAGAVQTPKAPKTPSSRSAQTPKTPKTPAPAFFVAPNAAHTPKAAKTPKTPAALAPSFFITAAPSSQAPQTQHTSTGAAVEIRRHHMHPQAQTTTGCVQCPVGPAGRAAGTSSSDTVEIRQGYPTLLNQLVLLAPQTPHSANPAQSQKLVRTGWPAQAAGLPVQSATAALTEYRERQSHIESRQLPFHM